MSAKKVAPKTVNVVYRGASSAVFVPRQGSEDIEFPWGEPVEVPADLADLLCQEGAVFVAEETRGGSQAN